MLLSNINHLFEKLRPDIIDSTESVGTVSACV